MRSMHSFVVRMIASQLVPVKSGRVADLYGMVGYVRVTGLLRRFRPRAFTSAWLASVCALCVLAGVIVAFARGTPATRAPHASAPAAAAPALPKVTPSTGNQSVLPGFGVSANFAVPATVISAGSAPAVAPLRGLRQADFFIVSATSLPSGVLAGVLRQRGVTAAESIEAARLRINGAYAAVLGVDPSSFRSYAERPTAASNALWGGVANGGIAVSYTMGKLDHLSLGGTVLAAGATSTSLPIAAFGTLGIGGVDAVVSHAVAHSLGMPAGNAIVVSASSSANLTGLHNALARLLPRGAAVVPLVRVVTRASANGASSNQVLTMLRAAYSRLGMPYVWGAAGPASFDCSGLVQWSFAQAGIRMPRVAASQALAGAAVPTSQLKAGDLLFYHTDPTAPNYISHVAIYLGNGWMIQAPEPGLDVEVVPAALGSEFAGAVRVVPQVAAQVAATLG
jgi:peptidoglycan DL-endopeptidase CwlO